MNTHELPTFYSVYPEAIKFRDKIFGIFATHEFFSTHSVEYVRQIIRQQILQDKRIFFDVSGETILSGIYDAIHDIIDDLDVDESYFFALTMALDGPEVYEKYRIRTGKKKRLTLIAYPFCERIASSQCFDVQYHVKSKPKKFLCFNKVERYHRLYLYAHAIKYGWLKNSYYSFQGSSAPIQNKLVNYEPLKHPSMEPWVHETLTEHLHSIPLKLNITDTRPNPILLEQDDLRYFADSYLSIVTETLFYDVSKRTPEEINHILLTLSYEPAYKFITEKTFKPIAAKHPFIIVGQYNILKYLKELGYKTFHPHIDESYDEVLDDNERMNCITREILRLNNFSDEEWLKWQLDIQDVVDYNYNVLFNKINFQSTKWNDDWFIPR